MGTTRGSSGWGNAKTTYVFGVIAPNQILGISVCMRDESRHRIVVRFGTQKVKIDKFQENEEGVLLKVECDTLYLARDSCLTSPARFVRINHYLIRDCSFNAECIQYIRDSNNFVVSCLRSSRDWTGARMSQDTQPSAHAVRRRTRTLDPRADESRDTETTPTPETMKNTTTTTMKKTQTSPLMPIKRGLEILGEKVPSLPRSGIEVK